MKTILKTSILAIAVLLVSCTGNVCKINVTLPDETNDGKKVYLQELSVDGIEVINLDSTTVSDNKFTFKTNADSLTVRFLTIDDMQGDLTNMVLVFVEKGEVNVVMDTLNTVTGTPMNDRFRQFMKDDLLLDMKRSNYYQILEDKSKLRFDFLKEIIDTPAGEFFFFSYLPMLEPTQITDLIEFSRPEFQQRENVQNIKSQAESMKLMDFDKLYEY